MYDVRRTYTYDVRDGSTIVPNRCSLPLRALRDASVIFGKGGCRGGRLHLYIILVFGRLSEVHAARCRRPLGRRILRGDVTATGKPGLRNAVARFSDGKYMQCAATYSFPSRSCLVPRGNDARRPQPSGRNLLARQDKVRYEGARKSSYIVGALHASHCYSL